jgi:hypothetical protein
MGIKLIIRICIIFLLVAGSCEEEICMTCYRVGTGGIVQGTATKMCGEDGIQHLRDRGYLCR